MYKVNYRLLIIPSDVLHGMRVAIENLYRILQKAKHVSQVAFTARVI
jgi:hypothetical protein